MEECASYETINYGFARPRTTDKNVYISNSLLALALHSPKCVYVWTRTSAGFRPQVGDELQLRPPLLLYLTSGGCRNSSATTDLFIFPTLCLQIIFYHTSACDLLFRELGPNSSAVLKGSTASPLCILASGAIVNILILASDTIVSILWGVRAGWGCSSTLTKSWQANGRLSDPGEHWGRDPSDRVLTIFTSCFDEKVGPIWQWLRCSKLLFSFAIVT